MDINECIVKDGNEYINILLKLVDNKKFYNYISEEISKKKSKLFECKESIIDWNNLLLNL